MKKRYMTLCMMMAVILTACKAEPKYVTETVMNKFVVSYPGNWNVSDKEGNIRIYSGHLRSVYKELHADHETGAADNK